MTVDQQFTRIAEKLQQLVRQQARLKKENERLRLELEEAKAREKEYQKEVDELNQQIAILKFTTGELDDKDKKDFEKRLNQYIREIEKCIAYLSQ